MALFRKNKNNDTAMNSEAKKYESQADVIIALAKEYESLTEISKIKLLNLRKGWKLEKLKTK